jgi:hypothetical protein
MSWGKVKDFTKGKVILFFDLLSPELEKVKSDASKVFNVDEMGIIIAQHKFNTVVSIKHKGQKQVSNLTSTERGSLLTRSTDMSASGTYVTPLSVSQEKYVARIIGWDPSWEYCSLSPNKLDPLSHFNTVASALHYGANTSGGHDPRWSFFPYEECECH